MLIAIENEKGTKKEIREKGREAYGYFFFFCNEGNWTNGRVLALAIVIKGNFNYSPSPFKTFVYPRRVKLSVKSVISRRHFFKIRCYSRIIKVIKPNNMFFLVLRYSPNPF